MPTLKRLLAVALLATVAPLHAQHVRHLDETFPPRTYSSLEEWLGRADSLRTHILVSTGLWPMPPRTPLSPRLSPPIERDGYTVQNVVLETRPGFFLTGNLYRPSEGEGPYPAVLSAHGHWDDGRFEDSALASVPGRAIQFARMGFVVFSSSMVGYNETADILPHRFNDPRYELWGFSVMGLQLWNSIRALDFLSSLPDVDPERIGATGASGGGTQTFMITAVDPRVKVAAPVNMISAHMQGGCVCENAPLLRLDATNMDIGALAAPRPLLMVSTSGDWTKNTPQVEYPAVRAVYRLFGAEERVANVHLDYPHNYNAESRAAAYAWFSRWLQNRTGPVSEAAFRVEDPAVLSADVPPHALALPGLFDGHREAAAKRIDEAKPRGWSDIFAYRDSFGAAFRHVFLPMEETVSLDLDVRVPPSRTQASPATLIVRPNTTAGAETANDMVRKFGAEGRMVFVLNPYPRLFQPPDSITHWTTYNPTTAARKVEEIRQAVEQILRRSDVTSLDLIGIGEAGPWTMLARALVSGVGRTTIDFNGFRGDDDGAYLEALFIPLLRKAGDFKTAAVLIAPAPLELRGVPEGPLRTWIPDVYRAAGASDMVRIYDDVGGRGPARTTWQHLSSAHGELPLPNGGDQQTAALVMDADGNGAADFFITERTRAPSVIWYRYAGGSWSKHVVDDDALHIEAGSAAHDIDGDGDVDIVFAGDSQSNEVWWWENPAPDFHPERPWTRRTIKSDGGRKHHDQVFGDFDGDGRVELAFWNQGAKALFLAEPPPDPRRMEQWSKVPIYRWDEGGEHEGLAAADVDRDGTTDLIGGGRWFKHRGGAAFDAVVIDDAMRFTRAAAGQFKEGGAPEIIFVPGDADGPIMYYESEGDPTRATSWSGRPLQEDDVIHGHSIDVGDVDGDGRLDLFSAEMHTPGRGDEAVMRIFFGDGAGGFHAETLRTGIGNHESKLADLDGDGDLDILTKPYTWNAPRVDVWLNGRR